MTNKKLIIIIMAVLLTSLSSCAKKMPDPVSEETIRQEIITLLAIDDVTVKLSSLSIDSNTVSTVSEIWDIVKTTVVLENQDAFSTLKVILSYVYTDSKWVFTLKSVEFVSAITKTDGSPELAFSTAISKEYDNSYSLVMMGVFHTVSPLKQVELLAEHESGDSIYSFEAEYRMLETTGIGRLNIKAKYDYPAGWSYTVDSWTYRETTQYTGDYTFTFSFQNSSEVPWFKTGQIAEIHLDGTMSTSWQNVNDVVYDNKVTGTMTTEGEAYPLTIEPYSDQLNVFAQKSSHSIKLTFGTGADNYLILVVNDGTGHGGEPSPAWWEAYDAYNNLLGVSEVK